MLISKFDPAEAPPGVADLEARFAAPLPGPYKKFLLNYNGGYTPKTRFRMGGVSSDLRGFFGFGSAKLPFPAGLLEDRLPEGLLPIARDSFGNHILLAVTGENSGSIYFADHERGGALILLKKDFAAFVRACKSEVIPPAARRSVEERRADLIARGREKVITPALIQMWQDEIDKYGGMIQEEVRIED